MKITKETFGDLFENKSLKIAFVGMSNVGKSYNAKKLRRELGFSLHTVDAKIQEELGYEDMDKIAKWMGYPDSPGYADREAEYLSLEENLKRTAPLNSGNNISLDTTGSVIYLSEDTLRWLQENFFVITIDVTDDDISEMKEKFFIHPKPVVWNGLYNKTPGESSEDALRRCYPHLLQDRIGKYRKLGDIVIPRAKIKNLKAPDVLEVIKEYASR